MKWNNIPTWVQRGARWRWGDDSDVSTREAIGSWPPLAYFLPYFAVTPLHGSMGDYDLFPSPPPLLRMDESRTVKNVFLFRAVLSQFAPHPLSHLMGI